MRKTVGLSHALYRGVAQLVARTAGGREVACSSQVAPTRNDGATNVARGSGLSTSPTRRP